MRLETIQAAGYYTKLVRNYYETITKEDNLLKNVATPKIFFFIFYFFFFSFILIIMAKGGDTFE